MSKDSQNPRQEPTRFIPVTSRPSWFRRVDPVILENAREDSTKGCGGFQEAVSEPMDNPGRKVCDIICMIPTGYKKGTWPNPMLPMKESQSQCLKVDFLLQTSGTRRDHLEKNSVLSLFTILRYITRRVYTVKRLLFLILYALLAVP